MAEVLKEDLHDLPEELRRRLVELAALGPATRVREVERALEEQARG